MRGTGADKGSRFPVTSITTRQRKPRPAATVTEASQEPSLQDLDVQQQIDAIQAGRMVLIDTFCRLVETVADLVKTLDYRRLREQVSHSGNEISGNEMARRCGIAASTWGLLEREVSEPRLRSLEQILRFTNEELGGQDKARARTLALIQAVRAIDYRHLRENLNLTREQLAQLANVKPNTIRLWEIGAVEPTITSLTRLASELKKTHHASVTPTKRRRVPAATHAPS